MKLSIKSESKENKFIYLDSTELKVTGDIFEFIKKTLKAKNVKLSKITEFKAIPSNSFTGYREATVIANTLNFVLLGKPINNLKYPKYHKSPNINIK